MLRIPNLYRFSTLLSFSPIDTQFHVTNNSLLILQYNESYLSTLVIPLCSREEEYHIKFFLKIKLVKFMHVMQMIIVVSEEGITILTPGLESVDINSLVNFQDSEEYDKAEKKISKKFFENFVATLKKLK